MRNLKGQFNKGEKSSPLTEFKKGMIPWNKNKKWPQMSGRNNPQYGKVGTFLGRKHSLETIEKMRIKKLGKKRPDMLGNIFRSGSGHPNKGKKLSEEQKNKLNLSGLLKGRGWNKGIPSTWASKENNHMWKGGITPINKKIRKSIEFKQWREKIFDRDNWTDQKTGIKGGKLHPHHILNFAEYPELRFDINNGITLSEESHKEFHKIYGKINNTRKQLEEFLIK